MQNVKFGEWQPIETAPKDGTHILVHFWEPKTTMVCQYVAADLFCWSVIGGECWNGKHATHWMPLPPPPRQTERRHERDSHD